MSDYRYLVIGGGMTADAACRGIRDQDSDGSIGLFAAEPHPPYARPPLSKGLWKGKEESSIWRGTPELGVDVHPGLPIASVDLAERTATDADGTSHRWERLLIATGGSPRRLPNAPEEVIHFRTIDDFRRLHAVSGSDARVAIVGGGFIGSEIAAALAMNGCHVTMLFPDDAVGSRLFPRPLARFVNDYYREKGVDVLPGELVERVEPEAAGFVVHTDAGRSIPADVVVAGLGIVPSTALAEDAGFPVEDGVLVDEQGRVEGHDDVFAAGDVARFPVPVLGGTRRVEHEDHANTHGRIVGRNMAGAAESYDHLPFFYSDLFDLGYEAVGDVDARLRTIEEWAEPNRKGVVGYVDDSGKPRGFLLWDVWGKVDDARALLRAGEELSTDAVRALLA